MQRTWKDFSPPTSLTATPSALADSGNHNSTAGSLRASVGGGGDDGGGGDSGRTTCGNLDHKVQMVEGPVIRMGTGALAHADCPPVRGPGGLATWKDVSPPKEKRALLDLSPKGGRPDEGGASEEKNRNPIRTNPFHEGAGAYRGSDGSFQSVKRIRTDWASAASSSGSGGEAGAGEGRSITTWRDVAPSKPPDERSKRPESGYFSNDVHSEGGQESRDETDSSLSDSDSVRRDRSHSAGAHDSSLSDSDSVRRDRSHSAGTHDAGFHSSDYFYEDEFSVQFDTNLRQAVGGGEGAPEGLGLGSPTGSDSQLRDSLLQADLDLGPYQSQLSASRTSMEISSSERQMMCSSDVLHFSNDPLFTPTPPPLERQQAEQQSVSVDSLSQAGGGQETSNDPDLGVDCGLRREAYFLSFSASQQHSNDSDISFVSQVSSPLCVCV